MLIFDMWLRRCLELSLSKDIIVVEGSGIRRSLHIEDCSGECCEASEHLFQGDIGRNLWCRESSVAF